MPGSKSMLLERCDLALCDRSIREIAGRRNGQRTKSPRGLAEAAVVRAAERTNHPSADGRSVIAIHLRANPNWWATDRLSG
jgi:hypothetical protein